MLGCSGDSDQLWTPAMSVLLTEEASETVFYSVFYISGKTGNLKRCVHIDVIIPTKSDLKKSNGLP